ncbi:MAG: LytTR family transcriptional regulator DNA-binding domain-containing protein [Rhizobiaceae bacterium]|nr:LytTR family transcriptional regulator DNA-binding domain-containing protein [Rhizobiaceae bacterium]
MPIEVSHSHLLVLGSFIVSIMGAFTALRLTSNLRNISIGIRKIRVSQGAFALGISIWSMHFIAMLAMKLPVPISYDPLLTLASALISVLVVGLAFLSLHFGVRTKVTILIAGVLTGFGIAIMHYLGMSAISGNVTLSYSPYGIVFAVAVGVMASIAALELAYGDRSLLSIALGSVLLGLAISAMHHTAMYFTTFFENEQALDIPESLLNDETLALIVMMSSFVICGLFLLLAFPTANKISETDDVSLDEAEVSSASGNGHLNSDDRLSSTNAEEIIKIKSIKIPYEQNNVVKFISAGNIHAVKAEGHYTSIFNGTDNLFCPRSISRMKNDLNSEDFIQIHRSFLVSKKHIVGLRRDGDKSFCVIGEGNKLEIPVARSQVAGLRALLQSD